MLETAIVLPSKAGWCVRHCMFTQHASKAGAGSRVDEEKACSDGLHILQWAAHIGAALGADGVALLALGRLRAHRLALLPLDGPLALRRQPDQAPCPSARPQHLPAHAAAEQSTLPLHVAHCSHHGRRAAACCRSAEHVVRRQCMQRTPAPAPAPACSPLSCSWSRPHLRGWSAASAPLAAQRWRLHAGPQAACISCLTHLPLLVLTSPDLQKYR
jgi:hypothetical protein